MANIADMAYGTKLVRVTREAEHIMDAEGARLVVINSSRSIEALTLR